MTTIRPLLAEEVWKCVPGGHEFFEEARLPGKFNPDFFVRFWSAAIQQDRGMILGAFDETKILGVIGFLFCPDIHTGDPVAVETMWFQLKEERRGSTALRLFERFEDEARKKGCVRIAMIHLETINAEPLKKLYAKRGYVMVETHYLKELK